MVFSRLVPIILVLLNPFVLYGENLDSVSMLGNSSIHYNQKKWKLVKTDHLFDKEVPILFFSENEKIKVFLNASIAATLFNKIKFAEISKELCENGKLIQRKDEMSCYIKLVNKELYSRYSILEQNGKKYLLSRELVASYDKLRESERKELDKLYEEL